MDYLLGLLSNHTIPIAGVLGVLALLTVIVAWPRSRVKSVPEPEPEVEPEPQEPFSPSLIELPPSSGLQSELFMWTQGPGVLIAMRTNDGRMAMSLLQNADEMTVHDFISERWSKIQECLLEGVLRQGAVSEKEEEPLVDPSTMTKRDGETSYEFGKRRQAMHKRWKEKKDAA